MRMVPEFAQCEPLNRAVRPHVGVGVFAKRMGVVSGLDQNNTYLAFIHWPRSNQLPMDQNSATTRRVYETSGSEAVLREVVSDARIPTAADTTFLVEQAESRFHFIGLQYPPGLPDPAGALGRDLVRFVVENGAILERTILDNDQFIIRDWHMGDGVSDSFVLTRGYPSNMLHVNSLDGVSVQWMDSISAPSVNQIHVMEDWILVSGHHRMVGQVVWVLHHDLSVHSVLRLDPARQTGINYVLGNYAFVARDGRVQIAYPLDGGGTGIRSIEMEQGVPRLSGIDATVDRVLERGGACMGGAASLTYVDGARRLATFSPEYGACIQDVPADFLDDVGEGYWISKNGVSLLEFRKVGEGCTT